MVKPSLMRSTQEHSGHNRDFPPGHIRVHKVTVPRFLSCECVTLSEGHSGEDEL